jgi:hypothetical protein
LRLGILALWFRRYKSVKRAEKDGLEKYAGNCYESPEHAVEVGDGLLFDLGDVGVVPHLSEEVT